VGEELTNREIRDLKAQAQRIKPMLKVGKEGLSAGFIEAANDALAHHGLVKIKFDEFKEQKKALGPELAARTEAKLIMAVGHVVVLFRRPPAAVEGRDHAKIEKK
jgi:RNA-binding protein